VRRTGYLIGIVALGFALRAWGLFWGLRNADVSRRPHPDEWTVYWLFRWFGTYHNLDPCPNGKTACFFDWGTVFPYLAYGVHAVLLPVQALIPRDAFGPAADPEFVWAALAGRATSLLVSTVTIVVVYHLARHAFDPETGLAAAVVLSLCALPIQLAHFATPDSTTVFLLTCTLLLTVRATTAPSPRIYAAVGGCAGLAVGSEYHMVLLAVPVGVAWALSTGGTRPSLLIVSLVSAMAVYVVSNPYMLVHLPDFFAATEHTLRIRTIDSGAEYGDRWAAFGPAWLYVVRYPLGYGVGFALTGTMLAGTVWALYRRTRMDWILLSWVAVYFLLVTLSPAKFMRYSAPLLPVLAVLGGRCAVDLLRTTRIAVKIPVFVLAVAVATVSVLYDSAYVSLFTLTDSRTLATQWLERQAPRATPIAFDQLPNGLVNLPYFVTDAGYRPCFTEFEPSELEGGARYLMTDNYDLEEHPRILQAQVNAYWRGLENRADVTLVHTVHNVPEVLGWSFPIDGSPHDWRYPAHVIAIYRVVSRTTPRGKPWCFANLDAARNALYPGP
jgi:hypothetical protein